MPVRTQHTGLSHPGFVADQGSQLRSNGGRQVAWDLVPDGTYGVGGGRKRIPAGTIMTEIVGGDDEGKVVPTAAGAAGATGQQFVAETDMDSHNLNHAISGYGMLVGGVLYENLLPEGAPAAGAKTALNANGSFIWMTYHDSRGS